MPNFQRPDGSVSDGNWTSTPLWEKIDDAIPNDTESVQSENDPSNDIMEVSLTDLTDPAISTGHIVRIRMEKGQSGGGSPGTVNAIVDLYQTTTLIATNTFSAVANGLATFSFTLSSGEADNITDYDALRVRVDADKSAGARTSWLEVSGIEFETPSGAFVVEQVGWRWFEDGTGSLTALAAENTKPTLPGAENYGVIRVRIELEETGGVADTNKIVKIQYSGDAGTTNADMSLDDGSNDDFHMVIADGADTAGNTISSRLLANTTESGKYHETQVLVESLLANGNLEIDFAFWTRCVVPDRDYQFRVFWDGAEVPVKSGSSAIQLRGSTHATRQYTNGVLNSITGIDGESGAEPDVYGFGHGRKGFYDGARWWTFYVDSSSTLVSYKSTASLTSGGWGTASTRSFTNISANDAMNVVFKEIGGTKYVLLFVGDSSTQGYFRRGTISGSVITWDSTERTYTNPHDSEVNDGPPGLCVDDGDFLWVGGKGDTASNEIWAQRSTNTLDNATYHTFNTAKSASESGLTTAGSYDQCELIPLASSEVLVVYYDEGNTNLRARKCTESGGMGSPVTINTSTHAHSHDWGLARDVGGNEVYCLYGDVVANTYNTLLHVYNISGDSWAAGTNPSIDKSIDNTANDGIIAHWGDDDLLRVFYTITGTSNRDTTIRYKDYDGGTGGTWSGTTDIPAVEVGNGDQLNQVVDGANAVILIERGGTNEVIESNIVLEYYVVETAAPVTGPFPPGFLRLPHTSVRM